MVHELALYHMDAWMLERSVPNILATRKKRWLQGVAGNIFCLQREIYDFVAVHFVDQRNGLYTLSILRLCHVGIYFVCVHLGCFGCRYVVRREQN